MARFCDCVNGAAMSGAYHPSCSEEPTTQGTVDSSKVEWSKVMSTFFARFVKDESGATAIEYGLIAALISVAIIAGVKTIGTKLSTSFNNIQANLP
jgi:pilus assembly protein Flp/PilA